MIRKSDAVRKAVSESEWKTALKIAKEFRVGISDEDREVMSRAYECMVHPGFYRQIGIDVEEAIEQGKEVITGIYRARGSGI